AGGAASHPFVYSSNDRTDLGRLLEQHYPDPNGVVNAWAQEFVLEKGIDTIELLASMNAAIKRDFAYAARDIEGTQSPQETLERRAGTCRDFALLLIEAVRSFSPATCTTRSSTAPTEMQCRAPPPPTPGPTSTCRAPAGWNTTRRMA